MVLFNPGRMFRGEQDRVVKNIIKQGKPNISSSIAVSRCQVPIKNIRDIRNVHDSLIHNQLSLKPFYKQNKLMNDLNLDKQEVQHLPPGIIEKYAYQLATNQGNQALVQRLGSQIR